MRHLRRLGVGGGLAVAAVVLAVGVAVAYWTAGGSGGGNATAGTSVAPSTLDASALTTAQLYPNATGDVKIRIQNNNAFGIDVTSIAGSGTITSDKGATCNANTGVTFTNQSGPFHLGPNATTTFTLTGAAAMSQTSSNACQGAIFTIPVTIGAVSSP